MLTILLTALLLFSCVGIVGAENTLSNIKAYFDDSKSAIVVSGVSPFGEGHLVSAKIELEGETIYFNFSKAGKNGKFEFNCLLDPEKNATGAYGVILGGAGINSQEAEKKVIFVDNYDTKRILDIINGSTADNILTNITAENACIDVDLTGDITKLNDSKAVCIELANGNFTSIPELRKAFNAAVAVQMFNEAEVENGLELLKKYEEALGLDLGGIFADIKTDELKSDVYDKICGRNIKPGASEFGKCFNKACYTSLFNGLNSSNRDKFIPYIEACNAAGYTDIDLDDYNALDTSEKVEIIKAVIEAKNSAKFSDLTDVASCLEEVTDELLKEKKEKEKEDDTPKRSSGGGGGGGGVKLQTPQDSLAKTESDVPKMSEAKKFNDLKSVSWAEAQIEYLAFKGIISGRDDGTFDPNGKITRAEFVKLLVSSIDLPNETTNNSFTDVTKDKWFYEPVMKAYALGFINGTDFDVFGAEELITREQLCAIVYRAMLLADAEIQAENIEVEFTDTEEVSEYALLAVKSMYRAGIVSGMGDGSFNPKGYATRAQAAKIIYGILERIGKI